MVVIGDKMTERNYTKEWFVRHIDTLLVLIAVLGGGWAFSARIDNRFEKIDTRLAALEKDVTIIKTVLMTKNFVKPDMFAKKETE